MATEAFPVQPTMAAIIEAYTPIYLRDESEGIDRKDSTGRIPCDRVIQRVDSPVNAAAAAV